MPASTAPRRIYVQCESGDELLVKWYGKPSMGEIEEHIRRLARLPADATLDLRGESYCDKPLTSAGRILILVVCCGGARVVDEDGDRAVVTHTVPEGTRFILRSPAAAAGAGPAAASGSGGGAAPTSADGTVPSGSKFAWATDTVLAIGVLAVAVLVATCFAAGTYLQQQQQQQQPSATSPTVVAAEVEAIYRAHNPVKLTTMDQILARYNVSNSTDT